MSATRRDFVKAAAGTSLVAAFSRSLPPFLQRTACAASTRPTRDDTAVIVVQLSGGNDGLNTVVPYADDVYGRSRRTLRLRPAEVLKINDQLGFHPRTEGFLRLFKEGRLAVVQGIGYPNSDRNHETAMRDWHTGHPGNADCPTGWIGRAADCITSATGETGMPAVFVGPIAQPFALNAQETVVPSLRVTQDLTLHGPPLTAAKSAASTNNPLLQVATDATRAAEGISTRVQAALKSRATGADYPPFTLAGQFHSIAQLLRAGVGIRVFFTEIGGGGIGGFDNHANQLGNHGSLLHELSESIAAFVDDLAHDHTLDRVVLMTFSEFGRTVSENGRRGTGHGEAAPSFLVGGQLHGGLVGKHPSLTDLHQDALKFHTDFRRLYATVLDQWLGYDSEPILGARFRPLDLLA